VGVAVGGWQWECDSRIGCVSAVILIGGKLTIGRGSGSGNDSGSMVCYCEHFER
jgi:hypothetical protein